MVRAWLFSLALLLLAPGVALAATKVSVKLDAGIRPAAGQPVAMTLVPGSAARCALSYTGPRKAKGGPLAVKGASADKQVVFTIPRDARLGKWVLMARCGKRTARTTVRVANNRVTRGMRLIAPKSLKVLPRQVTTPSEGGGSVDAPGDGLGKGAGNGGYSYGYCTYYAWTRRPDLGGLGHAFSWKSGAERRGIPTGPANAPAVGAVAWWNNTNSATRYFDREENGWRNYGHVAYVEQVAGNRYLVREMNWPTWNVATPRWITIGARDAADGFVYGGPAGKGPGTTPPPAEKPKDETVVAPNGYQVVYGLAGGSGALTHLWYRPTIAGTLGAGPLGTVPGTLDVAAAPTTDGHQVVYNLGGDGSLNELYFKPGVPNTLGQGKLGVVPGAARIAAARTAAGEQVIYALAPSGIVTHLYYKPAVAGTLGMAQLATTPGTVDIAAMPTTDGYQVVYTLAADGTVYEIYFKPGVAGTLGQGKLGTMSGVTRIAAGRTAAGEQVVYGLAPNGRVSYIHYKPRVAGTLGVGPLADTPGSVDISSAATNDGYQVVYTLAADASLNELYYKPGTTGTVGQGKLGSMPGVTQIAAAND